MLVMSDKGVYYKIISIYLDTFLVMNNIHELPQRFWILQIPEAIYVRCHTHGLHRRRKEVLGMNLAKEKRV